MTDQDAPSPASPLPIEETRRELERQATPDVITQVRRYAQVRVRLLRQAGRSIPKSAARELVDDAYADTWVGVARWNPSECPLAVHLRGVILQQTWRELRRGKKIRFVAMRHPANDNASPKVERALAAGEQPEVDLSELRSLVARVCDQLRTLVAEDHEAALLECWAAGLMERDEIMKATGLDRGAYGRARKRLMYKARELSPELRACASELFRSAS